MADVHSQEIRSFNMSQIKSKNSKPELLVRQFLHANGFRFKLHDKSLPGKPDIVLPKYNTVIQVNGCFWHGHKKCKYFVIPEARKEWWIEKISKTAENDKRNNAILKDLGWNVLTIWECELKPIKKVKTLNYLLSIL